MLVRGSGIPGAGACAPLSQVQLQLQHVAPVASVGVGCQQPRAVAFFENVGLQGEECSPHRPPSIRLSLILLIVPKARFATVSDQILGFHRVSGPMQGVHDQIGFSRPVAG